MSKYFSIVTILALAGLVSPAQAGIEYTNVSGISLDETRDFPELAFYPEGSDEKLLLQMCGTIQNAMQGGRKVVEIKEDIKFGKEKGDGFNVTLERYAGEYCVEKVTVRVGSKACDTTTQGPH